MTVGFEQADAGGDGDVEAFHCAGHGDPNQQVALFLRQAPQPGTLETHGDGQRAGEIRVVQRIFGLVGGDDGEVEDRKNKDVGLDGEESQAIIDGLGNCYYPILESLDDPVCSARRINRFEGERLTFEFADLTPGYTIDEYVSSHEKFIYILNGRMETTIDGETRNIGAGDIVQIKKDATAEMVAGNDAPVRYAAVESLPFLEAKVDKMRAQSG